MDSSLLLKVTHGEITSMRAKPLCDMAAFSREVNCFFEPENERATKVHPRLMARAHKSMGCVSLMGPFFFFEPTSAVAEYWPLVRP